MSRPRYSKKLLICIRTVKKLGLATTKHPRPYQLQGLGVEGKFEVTQQVRVAFSIGRYQDEVLCDVVPIQVCHLLLGEPWQSDRSISYRNWVVDARNGDRSSTRSLFEFVDRWS